MRRSAAIISGITDSIGRAVDSGIVRSSLAREASPVDIPSDARRTC